MSAAVNQTHYGSLNLGHGTYLGEMELVDNVYPNPHGYGAETCHFRSFKGRYEHGEMQLGVMNHKDIPGEISGTFGSKTNHNLIKYNNGCIYKGQTQNRAPHGNGIMEHKNGDKYSGHFLHGQRDGYGVYTSADKTEKGLWKDNKLIHPM